MRRRLYLMILVCVAATTPAILAGSIADSLAFQGRLTDASDTPVPDGIRDLIISIWTDSVGGTMLHSETVAITTSKGLYSTCIGCASSSFIDIFSGQTLFLQTQLAGQSPMTPRTRLRNVPFAVSSSSLHGQNAVPGGGVVSAAVSSVSTLAGGGSGAAAASYARLGADSDGDGHDDFFVADSALTNGVHAVTGGDLDGDGAPDLGVNIEVKPQRVELKLYDDSDANQRSSITQGADTDSANQMLATDLNGDGIPDIVVASSVGPTNARLAIKTKGTSAHRLSAGGDCDDTDSKIFADCDDDNDGVVDREAALHITPTTSSLAIKTKGTSAQRLSGGTDCDDTDATSYLDQDDDGDGVPEARAEATVSDKFAQVRGFQVEIAGRSSGYGMQCDTGGASSYLHLDTDNDGTPEGEINAVVMPGTCSVAINQKGTGADKGRTSSTTTPDSVVTEQTVEFSNSLLMPALMKAKEKANRTKCSNNLRYQSPITINEAELSVDSSGSELTMTADSDGDGLPEAKIGGKIINGQFNGGPGTINLQMADIDEDGVPEGQIESSVVPGTCNVAIKVRGTGADKNRVIGSSCDDSLAIHYLDLDDDGDGIPEVQYVTTVKSTRPGGAVSSSYAAGGRMIADSDDDGDPEGEIESIVTPGTCSVAIKTKGTGADKNRVVSQSDSVGADVEVSAGDMNIGLYVSNTGGSQFTMTDGSLGTVDTVIVIDGALKRFGIGVAQPAYPLHHSSGAHLTAGGVWTNASDENLKENFQPVDGADILDKIERLPISEWNYKTESDDIKHIGPTAQDFQKVFGIGENDKTISTIDPSGIALVAINELNRQNQQIRAESTELKRQNEQLRKELDDLKAAVAHLAAAK